MKVKKKYASAKVYYHKNKDKLLKKTATWRAKNKEKVLASNLRYQNSERGFFVGLWNDMKKSKKHNSFKDFDDFFDHWEDQKKAWGWTCPATGVKMTIIRGSKNGKKSKTNVSRDRILSHMGYSRKNLIFTSWQYNNNKCAMSPEEAMSFLRIVRDRYGIDYLVNIIEGDKKLHHDKCKSEYDWNDGR